MKAPITEPRWDLAGNEVAGVPVEILWGTAELLAAKRCGNLPRCYVCRRQIARTELFASMRANYLQPQSTDDIVRDYVFGRTTEAARATVCTTCWADTRGGLLA